jgi:hypothetical protein
LVVVVAVVVRVLQETQADPEAAAAVLTQPKQTRGDLEHQDKAVLEHRQLLLVVFA